MEHELDFSVLENLKNTYDQTARQLAFSSKTKEEYHRWKTTLREKLIEVLGIPQKSDCEFHYRCIETEHLDGYTREKILIDTDYGVTMPLYVLKPDFADNQKPLPCAIAVHGHGCGGKYAIAGVKINQAVVDAIAKYNDNIGEVLVKKGFIVFCPDARGFGERQEPWEKKKGDLLASSCTKLNHMAIGLGMSLAGMMLYDLMRLIDYIQTRKDCDFNQLGCLGLSGGGFQTLFLTALDDRIKACIVSGYFYGIKESLLEMPNCACNYVPSLWKYVDMGDIGALIAPRPFFIETGDVDHLNGKSGLDNVYPQVAITTDAYELFDKKENLCHHVFSGPHKWCGEKSMDWFIEKLKK